MEQFLARLGLVDLQVTQLEQTLDAPIAQNRKEVCRGDWPTCTPSV